MRVSDRGARPLAFKPCRARRRVPHDREQVAADAAAGRLHETERGVRGNRRVDGGPAAPQHRDSDLRCERLARRDHAALGRHDGADREAIERGPRGTHRLSDQDQSSLVAPASILAISTLTACDTPAMSESAKIIAATDRVSAPNYDPLPVVIARAEGVWAWDVEGRKYLDCISAYSSLNQGHRHPRIVQALIEQAGRLTLTSRAVHNVEMGPFLAELCALAGFEMALPMNTGAEAVETAIKLARRWGYRVKGVPRDRAEIVACRNNFHGRTTTIVGFSSEQQYREDFGPFTPGFTLVELGDVNALRAALTPSTVAFLVEPIQAEAGILLPPEGYLAAARALCRERNVLFMLDEIQTGLGRTGKMFAHEHEAHAKPDVLVLGKALGGGVYPVSAVLASRAVMTLFKPGDHGSTFGGNALAAAVGRAALRVLVDERLAERAAELGAYLLAALRALRSPAIADVRGRGLLLGVEIAAGAGTARELCERLAQRGVLAKDTHAQVIRFAPPLVVERAELDWLVEQLRRGARVSRGAILLRQSKRRHEDGQDRDGDSRGRLFLGHAGPDPQAARCSQDARRLQRRRRAECDLSTPRHSRRGHRNRVRSREALVP